MKSSRLLPSLAVVLPLHLVQLHKSYWVFIEHGVLVLRRSAEGGARGAKEKTLPALRSLPSGREAIQRLFPRMSCEAALVRLV